MNTQTANDQTQQTIRDEIQNLAPQFKAALPPHVPVERFVRTVLTAVVMDPTTRRANKPASLIQMQGTTFTCLGVQPFPSFVAPPAG